MGARSFLLWLGGVRRASSLESGALFSRFLFTGRIAPVSRVVSKVVLPGHSVFDATGNLPFAKITKLDAFVKAFIFHKSDHNEVLLVCTSRPFGWS
jgi:hypothetical protein